jgi:hypothetical protein
MTECHSPETCNTCHVCQGPHPTSMHSERMPALLGTWSADDPRRAFVAGASWWEFEKEGATIWSSDRDRAEAEAEKRYPGGRVRE